MIEFIVEDFKRATDHLDGYTVFEGCRLQPVFANLVQAKEDSIYEVSISLQSKVFHIFEIKDGERCNKFSFNMEGLRFTQIYFS